MLYFSAHPRQPPCLGFLGHRWLPSLSSYFPSIVFCWNHGVDLCQILLIVILLLPAFILRLPSTIVLFFSAFPRWRHTIHPLCFLQKTLQDDLWWNPWSLSCPYLYFPVTMMMYPSCFLQKTVGWPCRHHLCLCFSDDEDVIQHVLLRGRPRKLLASAAISLALFFPDNNDPSNDACLKSLFFVDALMVPSADLFVQSFERPWSLSSFVSLSSFPILSVSACSKPWRRFLLHQW